MPNHFKKQKLYCYVDETGQDTKGEMFIVSVVVVSWHRDALAEQLEMIERETHKGRVKWTHTKPVNRLAYFDRVLSSDAFKGKLNYALFRGSTEYLRDTLQAAARPIETHVAAGTSAIILVDGLQKSLVHQFGTQLHRMGIRTRKVRGIRKEEADALMRLADAVCGFVRDALMGNPEFAGLFERAKREGHLREV